jgi:hypothetical protein
MTAGNAPAQGLLADRCADVARLSREALAWVTDEANAETVGPERRSLTRRLRRAARRADRLARAARTRMSVSVFGPSQAGKSFLVSVLARPEGGRLVADFPGPGGTLDYISQINPEGEGESTGLVTRFTRVRDPAPEGFPIRLVLLTDADIARTVINSFYRDGDQSEDPPEPAALTAHLDAFRGRTGALQAGLAHEDVLEIADYVGNTFGRSAHAAALRGFWEEAAEIAPRLPLPDRAAFLSILWGGHQALTDLYAQLAGALAAIDHAEEVHVPLAALTPRETSIIDVKTLHGLMDPAVATGATATLAVRTPGGRVVDLPRAAVCALAAELVVPMRDDPSPLFATTDLLDFPGARNRFKRPLSVILADPAKSVPEVLLRGKVSYLFDRYVEMQEITSMLLCIPDSNMDTVDLPGLTDHWIALTHGNAPDKRADQPCILFLVLTKFDKHLADSAASGGDTTRFERRMFASLQEKFGKGQDDWVNHWTPDQPFRNCYWLRNPNYFVDGLLDYDDDRREMSIRPDKVARMAELREGCLAAPSVQRHFRDPAAAWDAAMTLNDGGVSYLTGRLAAVCRPDSKIRQISAQIDRLAADLTRALDDHHVDDDVEARILAKRQAASIVIDSLEAALGSHRFGAVMDSLSVAEDSIHDRIVRVPSSVRITSAVAAGTGAGTAPSVQRPASPPAMAAAIRPPRQGTVQGAPTPGEERPVRAMTAEAFQAETAVEVWIDALKTFQDSPDILARTGFTEITANHLIGELIHGLRRAGVIPGLMADLRAIGFGQTMDRQALPAAVVCAEAINRFVATLGADRLPPDDRPQVALPDGTTRPVFADRPAADTADGLTQAPRLLAAEVWTDWVHALEALFVDNARDGLGTRTNIEQNLRLGRILAGLGGDRADAPSGTSWD